jgi:mono/diheme cytochrome c family protein
MRAYLVSLVVGLAVALVLLAAGALAVELGWIDVAAGTPHTGPVEWLLERTRQRSVAARAAEVAVPPLGEPGQIATGVGLYRELCAGCHGAPGVERSAVGRGLNPPPPDLAAGISRDRAAEAWWITAHGIRMSGMPAFAPSLTDEQLWALVAALTAMEEMTPEEYGALAGEMEGEPREPAAMLHSPRHGDRKPGDADRARGADAPPGE